MATLYQLTGDLLTLQQMIEDGTEGLQDTLESIQLSVEEKLEGYAMVIKNIESDVDGLKAEEKRLADRRKRMENEIQRMKDSMAQALETIEPDKKGTKRLKTEKFTFSFRKSTSVQIVDETKIPEEFFKVERTISRSELTARLKEHEIPGAELVEKQSLQIK